MNASAEHLREFLCSRRSVRRFLAEPIPRELIDRILETATWAPSSHNRQPWRFAVLFSQEAKERLANGMAADFQEDLLADGLSSQEVAARVERSRSRILEAPIVILLCYDPSDMDEYPDELRRQAEYVMGVQSVALAGGSLLLAAHAVGLGGVWVCAPLFAPETVRKVLDLPPMWQPQGMLLLGYAAKLPEPRPRRPINEISIYQ